MTPVRIFIFAGVLIDYIGRYFRQAWSILGAEKGNPQILYFSLRNAFSSTIPACKFTCLFFYYYFFFPLSCFSYVFLDGLQCDGFQMQWGTNELKAEDVMQWVNDKGKEFNTQNHRKWKLPLFICKQQITCTPASSLSCILVHTCSRGKKGKY